MNKRNDNINKILIIRLSSIGDIILTTEFIRVTRKEFPYAQLDFLTLKKFSELLRFNHNISNLIEYDKSLNTKEILRARDKYFMENNLDSYDIIFDLQNNIRSHQWTNGIGKIIHRIRKWRLRKLKIVQFKKLELEVPSIPINYLDCGVDYGFKSDNLGLEIYLEDESKQSYKLKSLKNNPIIGIAPGAHHFTKRYPPNKFARLLNIIADINPKYSFKIFGSKEDEGAANLIYQANPNLNIDNYTGKLSLLETASEIDKCGLMISNDTGLMHIASARKVPVLAIFGSTVTNFGFSPYGVPFKIVESEEKLSCRPCSHIGKSKCPKGHFKCMENIEPEFILQKLKELET